MGLESSLYHLAVEIEPASPDDLSKKLAEVVVTWQSEDKLVTGKPAAPTNASADLDDEVPF